MFKSNSNKIETTSNKEKINIFNKKDKKDNIEKTTFDKNTNASNNVEASRENKKPEAENVSKGKETETAKDKNIVKEDKNPVKNIKDEEKALAELAEKLGISVEMIKSIFEKLNIELKDLLIEQDNVIDFTMETLNVDSREELLEVPNLKETLESITKVLETNSTETPEESLEIDLEISDVEISVPKEEKEEEVNIKPFKTSEDLILKETLPLEKKISIDKETEVEINTLETELIVTEEVFNNNSATEFTFEKETVPIVNEKIDFQLINEENNFQNVIAGKIEQNTMITSKVSSTNVMNQITNYIKTEVKGNISSLKMTLHPETLGDVQLKVSTQNGIVTAQFLAESEKVKAILESNLDNLKNALNQQGIEISSLSVSVGQDNQQKNFDTFFGNTDYIKNKVTYGNFEDSISSDYNVDSNIEMENAKLYGSNVMYKV